MASIKWSMVAFVGLGNFFINFSPHYLSAIFSGFSSYGFFESFFFFGSSTTGYLFSSNAYAMIATGFIITTPYFWAIFWLKVVLPASESPTNAIFRGIYNGIFLLYGNVLAGKPIETADSITFDNYNLSYFSGFNYQLSKLLMKSLAFLSYDVSINFDWSFDRLSFLSKVRKSFSNPFHYWKLKPLWVL